MTVVTKIVTVGLQAKGDPERLAPLINRSLAHLKRMTEELTADTQRKQGEIARRRAAKGVV